MSSPPDPRATIERMFAAFQAGDLDALLTTVHPESRWSYVGANPQISRGDFSGSPSVRKFFERILKRLEMTEFSADQYTVEGDTVVAFGHEAGTVRASGRPFRNYGSRSTWCGTGSSPRWSNTISRWSHQKITKSLNY